MTDLILAGSKGGGSKPRPSVEAPDSLQSTAYARILDLVSEGEIVGLKHDKHSVFLDETPLANEDGSLNFNGVTLDVRTGSQDQAYIPGFPAVENESAAAVELRSDQPWTKAFTNLQLSAVRIRLAVSRLAKTNTSNGDTNGYTVEYAIDLATDGGAFVQVLAAAFSGKTTTKYERSHRIDLPAAKTGWTVRVRRVTPNSTSGTIADTTSVESSTEVIDAKLRYPGSAIIGLQFDASQFQSIPARSFELLGRIIRVPSNYNPLSRVYAGVWDGTFKSAWTDNPAWIYYDLLLHPRYGLGHLLNAGQVDKWELYRIAQYCDQPVPDGKGGTEPRFTCNLYLSVRADALKVLQDLATTFRGMSYWGAGSVMAVADMPEDPVYTYSNANVIDGQFVYGGSAKKTRYTVALVSWNDPSDFYRQKVQYVDDADGIARYGVQQTEISATGCTSQAQAQRVGKWALLTNRLETESVTFAVGLDGTLVRPGQIIRVADNDRAGRRIGGRLHAATRNVLTLDADHGAMAGDTITLVTPDGKAMSRVVKSVSVVDGFQVVVLVGPLAALPPAQSMWAIDSPNLATQQFRVLSIAEDFSVSDIKYSISAVKHVPSKFGAIDNGSRIERPPVTVIPPGVQAPPTAVTVSNNHFIDQGSAVGVMTIDWARPANAIAFEAYWRKNDGEWVFAGRTGGTSMEVRGIYAGRYVAKVRAINALDIGSIYATSQETQLDGKTTPPPSVTTLKADSLLFGIGLSWEFPPGADDTQRTEIWYGPTPSLEAASKLADLAYPQRQYTMQSLLAGAQLFFWARLVDRTGNIGPWYPTGAGVMGQASADAGPILEHIAGQIGETQLGKDLLARIELIDGPLTLPGSVNERLKELDGQIGEVTGQLQGQIDAIGDLADALKYDDARTYAAGDSVRQGQRLYQAAQAVPVNQAPPNATYWLDVGQVVIDSAGLVARVSTTETKITDIEGVTSAQGSAINGLQSTLTGKADAAALNSLSSRVTEAQDSLSSQGTAITGLSNRLGEKADASTVQALSNTVTEQGNSLSAQGQALTNIQASVAGLGAAGSNLLMDRYSWLTSTTLPSMVSVYGLTHVGVAVAEASSGFGIRMTVGDTSSDPFLTLSSSTGVDGANIDLEPGTYLVSMYVQASATGAMRVSLADTSQRFSTNATYSGVRQRLAFVCTATAFARVALRIHPNQSALAAGAQITVDSVMVEKMAGANTSATPSPFVAGNSALSVQDQAQATTALQARLDLNENALSSLSSATSNLFNALTGKADNSALQSLSSTVTQQGKTLASQGTAVTQLQSAVEGRGGAGTNLLPAEYCSFSGALPTFFKGSAATLSLAPDPSAYSGAFLKVVSAATGSNFVALATSAGDYNLRIVPGAKYIVSFSARVDALCTLRVGIRASGTTTGIVEAALADVALALGVRRYSVVVTLPTEIQSRAMLQFIAPQPVAVGTVLIDAVMIERQVGISTTPSEFAPGTSTRQTSGLANAISTLDTRATNTEGVVTAQATRLDGIDVRVGDTSALVQQVSQAQAGLNAKASAMWSVKLQVNAQGQYVAAGIGLGIENTAAGLQSQFLVSADRFAVVNGINGALSSPFAVQGGQVFMNSAFIQDGTIGTAKITNAAIVNAKIADLSVDTAKIANASITTAKIGNLAVDTLRVAGRAITIPALAFTNGAMDVVGLNSAVFAWATIQELAIYVDEVAYAQVSISFGTCGKGGQAGDGVGAWRLLQNGALVASGDGVPQWGSTASSVGVFHQAGTSTYTLQAAPHVGTGWGNYGLTVQTRAISFMAVKR